MPILKKSLAAWNTPAFEETLKQELEALPAKHLHLQRAMEHGSALGTQPPKVSILSAREEESTVTIRVGIFFSSIIAGCNCADDPTPMDEITEYAQLGLTIEKQTGEAVMEITA